MVCKCSEKLGSQLRTAHCFRKVGFVSTPEPPVEVEDPFLDLGGDDTLLEGESFRHEIGCWRYTITDVQFMYATT